MDSCFRENKNTFVIAYLCWLVERGVFDEIFLSFLPTGHTHFDPDQFASRIATAVRFANVFTCEEYSRIIRGCWHKTFWRIRHNSEAKIMREMREMREMKMIPAEHNFR